MFIMNHTLSKRDLFKNLPNILLDQNGILGFSGVILLTVTQFLNDFPAHITAAGGFLMVLVSGWKTLNYVRRQNVDAARKADLFARRVEILRKVEAGDITEQRADFLLKHLDD